MLYMAGMNSTHVTSAEQKPRLKFDVRLFLWGGSAPVCAGAVAALMRYCEIPFWLRILLALTPLLPLFMSLRVLKQSLACSDELARHIARDAFAFAFYALFGLFICMDLLRSGGVLPGFVWDMKWLITAMGTMLALGLGWSGWRYR